MTEASTAESVASSDSGDSSLPSTNYTVEEIIRIYSDPGFVSAVETLFGKTT